MSSDGNEDSQSPSPSTASTVDSTNMFSLLQMLTAQNVWLEELRLQQDEQHREKEARLEEQRARAEEQRLKHEERLAEQAA